MRCALYLRVSTDFDDDDPRRQETANQEIELRRFAESQGWEIVCVYTDRVSGTKGRDKRLQFDAMMRDAAKRRFDLVLFWALDRLTREGPLKTLLYLEQFAASGVRFKSLTEPMLDTTTPVGELLIPILAWIAKQERQRISDRTRAGLETARRKGKILGRRRVVVDRDTVDKMRAAGASLRRIAEAVGASVGTIHKLCSTNVSETQSVTAVVSALA